jgi:hypothetical protein
MQSAISQVRPSSASGVPTFKLYTISFIYPHKQQLSGLKFGDVGGHLSEMPCQICHLGKRSFRKLLNSHKNWGGDSSCWKYTRPRSFKGTSFTSGGSLTSKNCRYVCPVRRPSKMKEAVRWHPKLHTTPWQDKVFDRYCAKWIEDPYLNTFGSCNFDVDIQDDPGGKDLTSGECSLGQTIPI